MVFLAYICRGIFSGAEAAGADGDYAGFGLDAEEAVPVQSSCNSLTCLRAVDVDALTADPG